MRKPGYIALAVLMAATLTLTGCSNVTEAKGSPTTEKEKVAEKTPQKRVKVIVENAAETAIETVRLVPYMYIRVSGMQWKILHWKKVKTVVERYPAMPMDWRQKRL